MKIIGLAGWSGAGKTTLIERVLPVLRQRGLRVSTLKHAHHRFDMDEQGKDSWRHRQAGAQEVLIASAGRWALLHELRDEPEPPLPVLLAKLAPADLVILEGWRNGDHAKVEVWRKANGKSLLHGDDAMIRGLICDAADLPAGLPSDLPVADSQDSAAAADLLLQCAVTVEPPQARNRSG